MKFYTPEKTVLMDITSVKVHPDGLLIEGKIMGAMPMKAILRAEELRRGSRLLSWGLCRKLVGMLLQRRAP